jgi:hypothetical protein
MFTPEFSSQEGGEFLLLASHNLESAESVQLSVEYNKARIAYGLSHAPANMAACRLVYDIRGQNVSDAALAQVSAALQGQCTLEFKR